MGAERNIKPIIINPFVNLPLSFESQLSLALNIDKTNLTPTGHRFIIPSFNNKLGIKGYFLSPVGVFGERSRDELMKSVKYIRKSGNFDGKATIDDVTYEIEVSKKMRETDPRTFTDLNFPIWKIVAYGYTDEKLSTREVGRNEHKPGIIICRHFPDTQYRLADCFIEGAEGDIEKQFSRLRHLWNLPTNEQVFIKSISRLATGFNALNRSDLIHGNLYWQGNSNGIDYFRYNLHNISLGGSLGDFEQPNSRYGPNNLKTRQLELVGGFVSYLFMIARVGNNQISDLLLSKLSKSFLNILDSDLKVGLKSALKLVQNGIVIRLNISRAGIKTNNGIEFFDDNFYIKSAKNVLQGIEILQRGL